MQLYGRDLPPLDYETLRQLERIAFGLTPSNWPDDVAHAYAIDAAIAALELMRRALKASKRVQR
jgi:hypothetical protein